MSEITDEMMIAGRKAVWTDYRKGYISDENLREIYLAMSKSSPTDEGLRGALETIADENSWRGFSPAPIVERMRELARQALSKSNGVE